MMHRDKEEDEKYALTNKTRPVYCPVCGWKIMDAVCGTKTPRPGFHGKAGIPMISVMFYSKLT